MTEERVVFQTAEGEETMGAAEVVRFSNASRISRGILFMVGGLLGGFMCIFIPLVHLVTTWLLPAGGIFLGYKTMQKKVQLFTPAGECPKCGKAMQLGGGSIDDRTWQMCPSCKTPITIKIEEQPAQPAV